MASLKELRNRIASVKSTQKITSAMKMVAASKLRRAQDQAEAGRPYAERMERMLESVAASVGTTGQGPKLLTGTGKDDVHLVVVVTSDKGLCGGFNASILRRARGHIRSLLDDGKTVKILTVGRKGRDNLRRDFADKLADHVTEVDKPRLTFGAADNIARKILVGYDNGDFDRCTMVYSRFRSAITQIPTVEQLVPVALPEPGQAAEAAPATGSTGDRAGGRTAGVGGSTKSTAPYEFEPDEETILTQLLPRNLAVQIYKALMESAAGEHGARMTAMDNATRNAGDMINDLSLVYNRTRQATITKELIEIISGAEAL
jgi:F-type H+-transporting ATPase subunit gamma